MGELIEAIGPLTGSMLVLIAVCVVVPVLAIVGGIVFFFARSASRAQAADTASQSWPSTTGTVLTSRAQVSSGEPVTVTARVTYEFTVGGQTYKGDTVRAGDRHMRGGFSGDAYKIVDHYPAGATVTVYYNPDNPDESALER